MTNRSPILDCTAHEYYTAANEATQTRQFESNLPNLNALVDSDVDSVDVAFYRTVFRRSNFGETNYHEGHEYYFLCK